MEILLILTKTCNFLHEEQNLNMEKYEKALDFANTLKDEISQNKCKINMGIVNGEIKFDDFKNNFKFF